MKYSYNRINAEKPKYEIEIEGDRNDGDYVTETTIISKDELDRISKDIYDWVQEEVDSIPESLIEYCPCGCHTYTDLYVRYYDETGAYNVDISEE